MTNPDELEALAGQGPVPVERLIEWRQMMAEREDAAGAAMFMGQPDAWFDDPHWFCGNGHVSARYLKSEDRGCLCLACREPVVRGPLIGEAEFALILEDLREDIRARTLHRQIRKEW